MGRAKIWDEKKLAELKKLLFMTNNELARHFNTTIAVIKWIKNKHKLKKQTYR